MESNTEESLSLSNTKGKMVKSSCDRYLVSVLGVGGVGCPSPPNLSRTLKERLKFYEHLLFSVPVAKNESMLDSKGKKCQRRAVFFVLSV